MSDPSTKYSLVLIGRYPGKDMAVAQALARCMAREESWGLRIVSSSPIIFFDNVTIEQATKLDLALNEVSNAGCRFEIQSGQISTLPRVGWSMPPRINGRPFAEIAPSDDDEQVEADASRHATPAIGVPSLEAAIAQQPHLSAAAGTQRGPSQATTSLVIPCPYTGQKIKLTLTIALSRHDGGTSLNVTASAAEPVARPTGKAVAAISGPVATPAAVYTKQTGPQVQLRNSNLNVRPSTIHPAEAVRSDARSPGSISSLNAGRPISGEQRPTSGGQRRGSGGQRPVSGGNGRAVEDWGRNTPSEIPLPDVPILPSFKTAPTVREDSEEVQPLPLDGPQMDMSTFEANFTAESLQPLESENPEPDPDEMGEDMDEDEENAELLCSVFIERSSSPVVHELVAELHGIPESEASELCVSGSVALAENIPLFEARDIKLRCAQINVFARIVRPG